MKTGIIISGNVKSKSGINYRVDIFTVGQFKDDLISNDVGITLNSKIIKGTSVRGSDVDFTLNGVNCINMFDKNGVILNQCTMLIYYDDIIYWVGKLRSVSYEDGSSIIHADDGIRDLMWY